MTKAVFFDWFNTLAYYDPPREQMQSQALEEIGILISPEKLKPGLLAADREYFEENSLSPIRKRSPEEQAKVYARYQQTMLTQAGVNVKLEPQVLLKLMKRVNERYQGISFALYDDVMSTLITLKEQKLILGLLSNVDFDMNPICRKLGLKAYMSFAVTSAEIGVDKPEPPIFLAALKRAGVTAGEAVHVGDQYKIDIIGARRVGITPILLDRYNMYPEVNDCPRIQNLAELKQYLT